MYALRNFAKAALSDTKDGLLWPSLSSLLQQNGSIAKVLPELSRL